jgi:hypothetical protein
MIAPPTAFARTAEGDVAQLLKSGVAAHLANNPRRSAYTAATSVFQSATARYVVPSQ